MRAVAAALLITGLLAAPRLAQAQAQPKARPSITATQAARFLAVAESAQAAPQARAGWKLRLDAARDSLESVLQWNNEHGQTNSSLRMLIALGRFWNALSLVSAYDQAFAAPLGTDAALRARALNSAAAMAFRIPDQLRTRRWARESISAWKTLGDSAGMGRAYERLVQGALRDGDHAALRVIADTGQFLCVRGHDDDCLAYFLNMRGESARVLRAYDSAVVFYGQADSIYRRISTTFRLDIAHNMGFALLALGRSREARSRFIDGMQHAAANADQSYIAFFFAALASCDAADGNATNAAKLFGLYDELLEKTGRVADPADAVEYERYRSRARNQLGAVPFADIVRLGRKLPLDSVLAKLR